MATESDWPYKETIVHRGEDYYLVNFTVKNLPTVGAIGYMVRKKEILTTSWRPYFFHLDTAYELVEMGNKEFIMVKLEVEHQYVHSVHEYFQKQARNLKLFLELKQYRKYTYSMSIFRLLCAILLMTTFVYPFFQSVRGYRRKPDIAWFLHPIFCFIIPILYAVIVIKSRVRHCS